MEHYAGIDVSLELSSICVVDAKGTQLASDRTSCRSALANQVRLVLHTAAYWLMLAVRDAIPKARDLAKAEFATLRLRLLKMALVALRRGL